MSKKKRHQDIDKNFDAYDKNISISGDIEYVHDYRFDLICDLSMDNIKQKVHTFLSSEFPEIAGKLKLRSIFPQYRMGLSDVDESSKEITGYLVILDICYNNIPIIGYDVKVKLSGNDISFLSLSDYEIIAQEEKYYSNNKVSSASYILQQNIDNAKNLLKIDDIESYDVENAELCYAFSKNQQDSDTREMMLTWCFKLKYQSKTGLRFNIPKIYMNAYTGEIVNYSEGIKR